MIDILGYDIGGRPLRVGDQVVMTEVRMKQSEVGKVYSVVGPSHSAWLDYGDPEVGLDDGGDVKCRTVRKLSTDHKPASQSFGELISQLKSEFTLP